MRKLVPIIAFACVLGAVFFLNLRSTKVTDVSQPIQINKNTKPDGWVSRIKFPEQPTSYPEDWPQTIRLPEVFVVYEAKITTALNPTALPTRVYEPRFKDYDGLFKFKGSPKKAASILKTYFETKGWKADLMEQGNLTNTSGLLLSKGSGPQEISILILIDKEPNNSTMSRLDFSTELPSQWKEF